MNQGLLVPVAIAVVLGLVLVYVLMSRQHSDYSKHVQQLQPKAKREKRAKRPRDGVFTLEEVAKHNTRDDAWIVVKHKATGEMRVYDITEYIDEHPGGESILNNVGGDATEGFLGPQHPDTVFVMVEEWLIGTLQR